MASDLEPQNSVCLCCPLSLPEPHQNLPRKSASQAQSDRSERSPQQGAISRAGLWQVRREGLLHSSG